MNRLPANTSRRDTQEGARQAWGLPLGSGLPRGLNDGLQIRKFGLEPEQTLRP